MYLGYWFWYRAVVISYLKYRILGFITEKGWLGIVGGGWEISGDFGGF